MVTAFRAENSIWSSIGRVLDETADWGEDGYLTAAEYISSAIGFANTGSTGDVIALLSGSASPLQIDRESHAWSLLDVAHKDFTVTRQRFRERLAEIVDTSTALRSSKSYSREQVAKDASLQLRGAVAAGASQMLLIPQPSLQAKPLSFRFLPRNLEAALGYVLLVLLRSEQGFGEDLCRCQLKSCERFFLKRATQGRPVRSYCEPSHLVEAHELDLPARVNRSRQRKKARRNTRSQQSGKTMGQKYVTAE